MSTNAFPFPDRELAVREIQADPASASLTDEEIEILSEKAWKYGEDAANSVIARADSVNILDLLKDRNITVVRRAEDNIAGGRRYFSVYETGTDSIILYMKAIELWAEKNSLSVERAVELILCHEFFHVLETKEIGYASKLVTLPILRIGKLQIGKKGIRALSEVGAHAFARRFFDYRIEEE